MLTRNDPSPLVDDGKAAMRRLVQHHEEIKERYEGTLLDSRLLVFNTSNRQNHDAIRKQHSAPKPESDMLLTVSSASVENHTGAPKAEVIEDPLNAHRLLQSNNNPIPNDQDSPPRPNPILSITNQSLRRIHSEGKIVLKNSAEIAGSPRRSFRSNGIAKDTNKERGNISMYSGDEDLSTADFDSCLHEYLALLFSVLESKRLDRSQERSEHVPLLTAPFERRDAFSADVDNRLHRRRCQGRLRKQLGDLCLLAGVPAEATVHYQVLSRTWSDILVA